jgi:hypothetical protein
MALLLDYLNERKIYSKFVAEIKDILKLLLVSLACLAGLGLINVVTVYLFNYYFAPHILAVPALLFVVALPFMLWKVIMLRFVPIFIINGTQIRHFNVLWYETLKWSDAVGGIYERPNDTLHLYTAAVTAIKADLSTISESDKNSLLVDCEMALKQHNAIWQVSEVVLSEASE